MADEIKNVEGEAAVQGNFIWDFIKEDTAAVAYTIIGYII